MDRMKYPEHECSTADIRPVSLSWVAERVKDRYDIHECTVCGRIHVREVTE